MGWPALSRCPATCAGAHMNGRDRGQGGARVFASEASVQGMPRRNMRRVRCTGLMCMGIAHLELKRYKLRHLLRRDPLPELC